MPIKMLFYGAKLLNSINYIRDAPQRKRPQKLIND